MVDLTRLNGNRLVINCDLIKFAEAAPDTVLTLVTGEKLIVRESLDQLNERITAFRGDVLRGAWPEAASPVSVTNAWAAVALARAEAND